MAAYIGNKFGQEDINKLVRPELAMKVGKAIQLQAYFEQRFLGC